MLPHTSPDGDALGSILGWMRILRAVHPEAEIHAISPDRIENYLSWLPALEELVIYPEEEGRALGLIAEAEVIFHLDHNEVGRLRYPALIEAVRESGAQRILIDHHLDPEEGCNPCFSYPNASATCELVYLLTQALGMGRAYHGRDSALLLVGISPTQDAHVQPPLPRAI